MLVRRQRLENIPVDVLNQVDGYIFLAEETPEFIAKNLVSRLKQYAETLKTLDEIFPGHKPAPEDYAW